MVISAQRWILFKYADLVLNNDFFIIMSVENSLLLLKIFVETVIERVSGL